jgi:hypothetical protein
MYVHMYVCTYVCMYIDIILPVRHFSLDLRRIGEILEKLAKQALSYETASRSVQGDVDLFIYIQSRMLNSKLGKILTTADVTNNLHTCAFSGKS